MRKAYILIMIAAVCAFFVGLQMILLSKIGSNAQAPISRNEAEQTERIQHWTKLVQKRRDKATWADTKDGAFIHMGKTGGSSLSLLLRNGCHSFMPKPCRTVPLETIASRMVGTYYHVPDFGLIPQGKHSFYIMTLRDPLARSISAFVYEHIDNVKARKETMSPLSEEAKTEAKKCFPSLEQFVEYIGDNPHDYDYNHHQSQIVATNCTSLARAVVDGKVRRFNHFFFPFDKIRSFIGESNPNPLIFATRQEHLWYDWKKINYLLGQAGDIIIPNANMNARDLSNVVQPVSRHLSEEGKLRLCKALQKEYDGYVNLLREAINLSDKDVQESLEEIKKTCPNVVIPA